MKNIIIGLTVLCSMSSFANTNCDKDSMYGELAKLTVATAGVGGSEVEKSAASVKTSCQLNAVYSLAEAGYHKTEFYKQASKVSNSYQAQAIKCLTKNDYYDSSIFNIASRIQKKCSLNNFCNLASSDVHKTNRYENAIKCN